MEITSSSLAETEQVAKKFLAKLSKTVKKLEYAAVVALSGELGAGKTTFVQAAARRLGISGPVQSPTFVIMKTYRISRRQWQRLVHIDCYRLSSGEDLLKLGWRDLAADAANLIMIEWPERVAEILPAGTIKVGFEILGENERKICVKLPETSNETKNKFRFYPR